MSEENKFKIYLKELFEYQEKGEDLNLDEFEAWKNKISNELYGTYKIRFDQLKFYEAYSDDDLPF